MELKIEDLLNNIWHEIEVYVLGSVEGLNLQKTEALKEQIDEVIAEVERQFSYTFIELGDNGIYFLDLGVAGQEKIIRSFPRRRSVWRSSETRRNNDSEREKPL